MRATLALMLLTACGRDVRLEDDFAPALELNLFGDYGDNQLSSPYTVGLQFEFRVVGSSTQVPNLTIESDDPEVLLMGATLMDPEVTTQATAMAQAMGVGTTTIRVFDDKGREREVAEVRVAAPDRIEIVPVPRVIENEAESEPIMAPQVLTLGIAEFVVRAYEGESALTGAVYPDITADPNAGVTHDAYYGNNLRDTVRLAPVEDGTYDLSLTYGGRSFDLSFDAVPEVDVAAMDVTCQGPDESTPDGLYYCMSSAADAAGDPIWGVQPVWSVDDVEMGEGDLFAYEWMANRPGLAVGSFGEHTVNAEFSGIPDSVTSTNDVVACSSVAPTALWLALLPAGLLGLRRRRDIAAPEWGQGHRP